VYKGIRKDSTYSYNVNFCCLHKPPVCCHLFVVVVGIEYLNNPDSYGCRATQARQVEG